MSTALPLLMFFFLLVFLLLGFPVAFTLAGTALLFGCIGHLLDLFSLTDMSFLPGRIWGIVRNYTLVAVPLFVYMGLVLDKAGLAEELLSSISALLRRVRGGLGIAIVLVGALLAASTGIVGATVVTMGVLSLPIMLKHGYDKQLACGTIAASGTLGQIIPPSIVLVLLGDIMNVDVGDLFVGALIPGLLLIGFYLLYVVGHTNRFPPTPAATSESEAVPLSHTLTALFFPLTLMGIVLGSILLGIASPTEAAACGASGALIIAFLKGRLSFATLTEIGVQTARITSMVFMILVGAQFFGVVFRGLGGEELITHSILRLSLDPAYTLAGIMLLIFALGFFLDFLEISFIVIPIVLPILGQLGYDRLWLAILIAINLQTSFLTPPFGFSLFYLKGVAPAAVTTGDIYRGVLPFVAIQLLALVLIACFPELVTWLPALVFAD